jgi:hypothetical protein
MIDIHRYPTGNPFENDLVFILRPSNFFNDYRFEKSNIQIYDTKRGEIYQAGNKECNKCNKVR